MATAQRDVSGDISKQKDKGHTNKNAGQSKEAELSDEDLELKNNLELLVQRVCEPDEGIQKLALETIRREVRTATSSMTSVPKPLKFLRPHYEVLKMALNEMKDKENSRSMADIISIMASTCALEGKRETLSYKLRGTDDDIGSWGHEYIRTLAGEIAVEFNDKGVDAKEEDLNPLYKLVEKIVPYHMSHNAEPEAVDLLIEVERLWMLESYVDEGNYRRTCLYLTSCSQYLPEPEDLKALSTARNIYLKMNMVHDAMRVSIKIDDRSLIEQTFQACTNPMVKKQLCYLLARQGISLDLEEGMMCSAEDDVQSLQEIISNSKLNEYFLELARDLDVMEAKIPEDVYKMHLVEGRVPSARAIDSARQNLASTFVNAFVNAGFGHDKLMTKPMEGEQVQWIFKNKEHGKISATASLGMITMWDVEGGLPQIDKYLYTTDNHIVAGALLAIGIVNCGVRNENDPAYALIYEHVNHTELNVRIGAVMGLGLAYAGTWREEIEELLLPLIMDTESPVELSAFAALSIGLVFSGTCKQECIEAISQALMIRPEANLLSPYGKMLCLGLGLLFLRKQSNVEATLEIAKTLNEKISKFCEITLEACAYAGSGNVLKVQEWLAMCGEHIETDVNTAWKVSHQSVAVLGIALVSMAEELGTSMIHRTLEHLLLYCTPAVRAAVPLAIAALNISRPEISPMDILGRLSHDSDSDVARNSILALGILGAGTNNARLAGVLRNLSSYYYKEATMLYLVRVSQGLVYMGKGLMTLNPYHTDGQLLSGTALSGILCLLYACFDIKETIAGKHHYMLYFLATAMKPRYLLTIDEEGKMLQVPVRVGTAVDIVAQAGRPKSITGFQTHNTPVLIAVGERAELATDKYLPLSPILEGVVILKKNPEYREAKNK